MTIVLSKYVNREHLFQDRLDIAMIDNGRNCSIVPRGIRLLSSDFVDDEERR
jgi:hypothetical protein